VRLTWPAAVDTATQELSAHDRPGLLADVTKKLADSGLTITKSKVSMQGPRAVEKFVVESDESKVVDAVSMHKVCMEIGQTLLEGGSVHYTQAVTPRGSLHTGEGGKAAAAGKLVRGSGDLNSSDAVLDTWISSGWA
jgi:predicted amino acid-binding ACT domain protein